MNSSITSVVPIGRRQIIGGGIATGLALAAGPTNVALAKSPSRRDLSPEYESAFMFAIQQGIRCGAGYWAVFYTGDIFTGEPQLIGNPQLFPKPQAGNLPPTWGTKSGSIVVGGSAVLRLIHQVDGQDTHTTLLPFESLAKVNAIQLADGKSSWKLYPADDLRPPY